MIAHWFWRPFQEQMNMIALFPIKMSTIHGFFRCGFKIQDSYLQENLDGEGLASEIKEAVMDVLGNLKEEGHQVEERYFSMMDYLLPNLLHTHHCRSQLQP